MSKSRRGLANTDDLAGWSASAGQWLPEQESPPPAATSSAPDPRPATDETPMPPPRRRRQPRVQLNTRVPGELYERLQRFIDEHDAAVQDVVEGALAEYLARRNS